MPHHRLLGRISATALAGILLSGPAAAQNGRIFGTVVDEDGQPLKGATVTAQNPAVGQTLTATTDAKGRYAMIALRGGVWTFVAAAPGYTDEGGDMMVRLGSPNRTMTFVLRRSGSAHAGALGGVSAKDLQRDFDEAERLFANERWQEAVAAYQAILDRTPVLTSIRLQIAAAYRRLQNPDAALAAYRALLDIDPGHARATVEMASTLRDRGDTAGAESLLTSFLERNEGTRELFYQLGEIRLESGDTGAATGWFEKAAAADPNWAKPLLRMGEQALARGEKETATRLLLHAKEVDPDAPEARTAHTILETVNR
ncbi:MAG: carboxypeptidase regulatory-like domain-containing protein [Vicinamibacterales bacterium]